MPHCELKWEMSVNVSQFNQDAVFTGAQFDGAVDFSGTHFSQYAFFHMTHFSQYANFIGTVFSGSRIEFIDVQFGEDADFHWAQFSQRVSFAGANFSQAANFYRAQFSEDVIFSVAKFQGLVYFDHAVFNQMRVRWSQLEGKLVYDDRAYISLITNFNNLGQYDDADNAHFHHRVTKRNTSYSYFNPRWYLEFIFLDLTCGYGVKPFRAIGVALFIILVCAAFYYRGGAIRQLRPDDNHDLKRRGRGRRIVDALYFSANTFTTVGYGDWYPTEQPIFSLWKIRLGSVRVLAMIEGLSGWFVLALFLVTLARVWIR